MREERGIMAKLLIVDDELDVREFAKNFFKRRKFEVSVASSGEQALSMLDTEKPDLVLLDVRLEKMNGIDVLRKMRESGNKTDVIMVTGINEKDTMEQAQQLGIVNYIHKPLILDELEKIVLGRLAEKNSST